MGDDRRRGRLTVRRDALVLGPIVGFVLAFAVVPALVLFGGAWAAGGGGAGLREILANPLDRGSIDQSLLQGGLTAAFAVAFGYPTGVMIGRYAWPGRRLVRSLLLVPFLLPSLIVVLGVEDLFGPGGWLSGAWPVLRVFGSGIPAIVGANLLFNVPIVALFTATGAAVAPAELEEAIATLGGGPARAYRDAWGPPTWVGAAVGGLLAFLFSALSFAPPLLLCGPRCYTVEAEIYALDKGPALDPTAAALLALLMVVVFLPATVAYLVLLRRLGSDRGTTRARGPRPPPRPPRGGALAAPLAAVVAAEAAMLAAVLYRSVRPTPAAAWGGAWGTLFSPATTERLGLPMVAAIGNTLAFATGAAAIALLFGIAAGFAVVRRPGRVVPLGLLLFVPLLLSPVVLAFALAEFWRPLVGGESTVWFLVIVSQSVLALPFALQSLEIPLAGVSRDGADAARALGASPWTAYFDVDLPRIREGIVTAGLFAFALGLGEFTATYFLVTPTFATVPVALYDLSCCTRSFALTDAVAGLLLLLSLATFGALAVGGTRGRR